ncbi:acyltransferase family protein [Bacteroides sedimenti]|uniref:acyltransferase family protein n=1 Tax=Bacteroides sedimenti TaxID=2136147 RepID=UPI00333F70ED
MNQSKRLLSLDVLRGITIAGMILVNNAGACGFPYEPLRHAKWDGFTPADLVFPMFMFLMGISTYISLRKYDFQWKPAIRKIVKRAGLLFLIGVAMKWFIGSCESGTLIDLDHLRIMGVMQRLGICYGVTAIMALFIPHKRFLPVAILLLTGYFILQIVGNGFEKSADNIIAIVDSAILGNDHMYLQGKQFVDPEGLLSSIPAIAQVMIGFVCGKIIVNMKDNQQRMLNFFLMGTCLLFAGFLLSYACPLNKRLWSPSFVLVTCGVAALSLAAMVYVIDVKQHKKWFSFFEVFGANPLLLYVVGYIFGELFRLWKVNLFMFDTFLNPMFGDYFGSFMYAVLFLFLNWILGYILFRKRIYIKL